MNSALQAVTRYDVPIAKAFSDRRHAISWAEENRSTFPGLKVQTPTKRGLRTIWRDLGVQS